MLQPLEGNRGATRIEVLLTVISVTLLGILAALVVPREKLVVEVQSPRARFDEWMDQVIESAAVVTDSEPAHSPERQRASKEAALASNVATVRMALEMYAVQHDDTWPDDPAVQLTTMTDRTGEAGTEYGPYLRNSFPRNPISGSSLIRVVDAMPPAPVCDEGWIYDRATGELRANIAGSCRDGTAYFDL